VAAAAAAASVATARAAQPPAHLTLTLCCRRCSSRARPVASHHHDEAHYCHRAGHGTASAGRRWTDLKRHTPHGCGDSRDVSARALALAVAVPSPCQPTHPCPAHVRLPCSKSPSCSDDWWKKEAARRTCICNQLQKCGIVGATGRTSPEGHNYDGLQHAAESPETHQACAHVMPERVWLLLLLLLLCCRGPTGLPGAQGGCSAQGMARRCTQPLSLMHAVVDTSLCGSSCSHTTPLHAVLHTAHLAACAGPPGTPGQDGQTGPRGDQGATVCATCIYMSYDRLTRPRHERLRNVPRQPSRHSLVLLPCCLAGPQGARGPQVRLALCHHSSGSCISEAAPPSLTPPAPCCPAHACAGRPWHARAAGRPR
jgi:hypothetical protein